MSRARRPVWWAIPVVAALVALRGLFTLTNIFYVRDLAGFFWPVHLWLRDSIYAGRGVAWSPAIGFGRSVISDPVFHILFPPAVLLRLLPDVPGFNLFVALPFPVTALGCALFFGRRCSAVAASAGACVFVLSGAMLSSGNMPNLAWSAAAIPWVLWATDRLLEKASIGRFATLAAVFALHYLAGEPVTLLGGAVTTVCYAATFGGQAWRARAAAGARVVGAGAVGLLLAAPQAFMFLDAASRSLRTGGGSTNFEVGSLHPLGLIEALLPGVFGDFLRDGTAGAPFLAAFAGAGQPLFYSVFVGAGALALAAAGAARRPRTWSVFWIVVGVAAIVLVLGFHTPVWPALRAIVPGVSSLRSPSKFVLLAALSVAALAAAGWDAIADANGRSRAALAILGASAAIAAAALAIASGAPGATVAAVAGIARSVGLAATADEASRALLASLVPSCVRLLTVSLALAGSLWLAGREAKTRTTLLGAFYALTVAELLLAGGGLNPTLDASLLREPEWATRARAHPSDRVYTIGKVPLRTDGGVEPDGVSVSLPPTEGVTASAANAYVTSTIAPIPLPWGVHEAVSFDATLFAPRVYGEFNSAFRRLPVAQRDALLSRVGVRTFVLTRTPEVPARKVADVAALAPLAVYEAEPAGGRIALVPGYAVEPDVSAQTEAFVTSRFDPSQGVLLEAEPPAPAGVVGSAPTPFAEITGETSSTVDIAARVPEPGGFLLLQDMYDPRWSAEVDGERAAVLRADGIFRAVRLAPGEHRVRFVYRPTPLYVGIAVSLATALALAAAALVGRRRGER